jgi:hypothetical protein
MRDDPAGDPKQTRAQYYRAEAEAAERTARKAGSATAMFSLLDMAADLREKAAQAELEEQNLKAE